MTGDTETELLGDSESLDDFASPLWLGCEDDSSMGIGASIGEDEGSGERLSLPLGGRPSYLLVQRMLVKFNGYVQMMRPVILTFLGLMSIQSPLQ